MTQSKRLDEVGWQFAGLLIEWERDKERLEFAETLLSKLIDKQVRWRHDNDCRKSEDRHSEMCKMRTALLLEVKVFLGHDKDQLVAPTQAEPIQQPNDK